LAAAKPALERKAFENLKFENLNLSRTAARAPNQFQIEDSQISSLVIGCQGMRNGKRSRVVWRDGGRSRTGNLARDNRNIG
jgi:hypothetical protein